MRQLKMQGITMNVPESWADVTLGQYNRAIAALIEYQKVERQAMAMAICALCNVREGVLVSLSRAHVMEVRQLLDFFFTTSPEPKLQMEFETGGTAFKVVEDVQNATFGEFVDMDTIIVNHKDDLRAAMPKILAVYCRPMGEPYNAPDLEARTKERVKVMEGLPVELAEGVAAFFLTSTAQPPMISSLFGASRLRLISRVRMLGSSLRRTGGGRPLRRWFRMIFSRYMNWRIGNALRF